MGEIPGSMARGGGGEGFHQTESLKTAGNRPAGAAAMAVLRRLREREIERETWGRLKGMGSLNSPQPDTYPSRRPAKR